MMGLKPCPCGLTAQDRKDRGGVGATSDKHRIPAVRAGGQERQLIATSGRSLAPGKLDENLSAEASRAPQQAQLDSSMDSVR